MIILKHWTQSHNSESHHTIQTLLTSRKPLTVASITQYPKISHNPRKHHQLCHTASKTKHQPAQNKGRNNSLVIVRSCTVYQSFTQLMRRSHIRLERPKNYDWHATTLPTRSIKTAEAMGQSTTLVEAVITLAFHKRPKMSITHLNEI